MPVLERQPMEYSDALRSEYGEGTARQSIINDVASYIGEYRLQVPKHSYLLTFKDGKTRDPHANEPMYNLCQKAIESRRGEGRSFIRETAELKGFERLDKQLQNVQSGETIIWMSPPGPKEEGYGNYGFVFFGKVHSNHGTEKEIKMTAIRVENPTISQFRKALEMFTGEKSEHESAVEFLDSPRVINEDIKEGLVDAVLKGIFDYRFNREEQERLERIMKKMLPLISDFANNPWRTREDLYALENYAVELKRDIDSFDREIPSRLGDLAAIYRQEPPKAAGSCGSTGSSNNILNSISSINSLFSENEGFTCPRCNFSTKMPVGNECPKCHLTKEKFTESGGEVCD